MLTCWLFEISPQVRPGQVAPSVRLMSSSLESDAEFDARFAKSFISNVWALGFGISVAWLASYPNLDRLRYIAYFDRADIDGWEIRKVYCVVEFFLKKNLLVSIRFVGTSCWFLRDSGILKERDEYITSSCAFESWPVLQYVFLQGMGDLCAMDLVPEPPIIASALRACRRVNDFSLTTRLATSAT